MKTNVKIEMLEHSKAKVDLYGKYLTRYINILGRTPFVEKIFLFDLLAGEGKYSNDEKGSPLIAIEAIQNHYFSNNKTCPQIEIWFNDLQMSEIEPNLPKIKRVENLIGELFVPNEVSINYFQKDFKLVLNEAIKRIRNENNPKGLFFIDPYGYKKIDPDDIKNILGCRNTEVFLFLPITHMYRFAQQSITRPTPGSIPLGQFLSKLFQTKNIDFQSQQDFVDALVTAFKNYFPNLNAYVDKFTLERNQSNIYCLFFFTTHIRGFEKMIETKWAIDKQEGKGYKSENAPMLLSEIELSNYPNRLKKFIESNEICTNHDLYEFGLENGFLPSHTNKVLKPLVKSGFIKRESLDGKKVQGNYIDYNHERTIKFFISK